MTITVFISRFIHLSKSLSCDSEQRLDVVNRAGADKLHVVKQAVPSVLGESPVAEDAVRPPSPNNRTPKPLAPIMTHAEELTGHAADQAALSAAAADASAQLQGPRPCEKDTGMVAAEEPAGTDPKGRAGQGLRPAGRELGTMLGKRSLTGVEVKAMLLPCC